MCGEPALILRTFDNHKITFIVAKERIKVSGMAHTFKNDETG